jgi:DNA-binding MarR family transcriptional regulator
MSHPPLSKLLSHALVAFTIELDNEFEHRLAEAAVGRHRSASLVFWSNLLRFVGDGISVGELPAASGLPRSKLLSMLGGVERWRYVFVGDEAAERPPETKRDGWGSGRGLRQEWLVRPTPVLRKAQELWPLLLGEIEARWEKRFGPDVVGELRQSLETVVAQLDVELPEFLPIVGSANGMVAEIAERCRQSASDGSERLVALLAKVLLVYTLDFEREASVSLPLSANFLRVLAERELDVRELPPVAGVSKEATSMALRFLTKTGYVESRDKRARLTPKGREAEQAARLLHDDLERTWEERFGADSVRRLRAALEGVLEQRDGARPRLSLGLQPYPDGWRASKPYLAQTNAVLEDPIGRLPHYPLVLHRGGWPDGS